MIINENELESMLQCPIMTKTFPTPEEKCGFALSSWVLRQSFDSKLQGDPSKVLHNIRGKLIELWEGDKQLAGSLSRPAAFRLLTLTLDYEVLHLEQPYNLVLSGYTIQGKYALLRKRRGDKVPFVLVLHTSEPELRHAQALPPDAITLSRYIHTYTNEAHTNAQVLHYPVFRGKSWLNKHINITLAKSYLSSILKTVSQKPQFPVMGSHCHKCISKPCLEVFKDG